MPNYQELTGVDPNDILERLRNLSNNGDDFVGTKLNDQISGLNGDDFIIGANGRDFLRGNAGADTLVGAVGSDTLIGGSSSDVLLGGDGNDFLSGETGRDYLTGGDGADMFHFHATRLSGGHDQVGDFARSSGNNDRLVLERFDEADVRFVQRGDNVMVIYDGVNVVEIADAAASVVDQTTLFI